MSVAQTETLIGAMQASFDEAIRTADGVAKPVALLWTDADGQWQPLIPALRQVLPQLFQLGSYAPDERQGPVIWLKCIVGRTLPEVAPNEGVVPILYLPNVGRQELRPAGDCGPMLQPLVELQYRGEVWHQRNGRDWTVTAFLTSDDGLGLDIAGDSQTRDAMLRALPLLGHEQIVGLRGRQLSADDFNRFAISDPIRDLLTWMSDKEAFETGCDAGRWATFCDVCTREFGIHPDTGGIHAAADALTEGEGKWEEVWQRFREAPKRYPGVSTALRAMHPKDLFGLLDRSRWPALNHDQEDKLGKGLEAVTKLAHGDACEKVATLDEEHKERRGWVWAELGESPHAVALEPLGRLARAAMNPLSGPTVDVFVSNYAAEGWRCDLAAIEALASLKSGVEHNLITRVVRALYEPWLDRSARRFQELLSAHDVDPGKLVAGTEADMDTCILFIDGLRFDLGVMLQGKLDSRGIKTRMVHRIAPIPTVTATAKPMASPAYSVCTGGARAENFYPLVSGSDRLADARRLREVMTSQGVDVLEDGEPYMAMGAKAGAWKETGKIDRLGHSLGADMVGQIDSEIESIVGHIDMLLSAGWKKVRVVTDHGWLLLPGGLPKIELAPYLVQTKWARCAAVQGESAPATPTYPWYWNPVLRIASPPGIGAFRVNTEYAHGGVSPQECVVPDLTVELGDAPLSATITAISWRGMRCRVSVDTKTRNLSVDLRLNWKQAGSSIAESKPLAEDGTASLVVSDDNHESAAVSVVVVGESGQVLDYKPTTVGEET